MSTIVKDCQRMTVRKCHFQKDCIGVSKLKGMLGSITIKRSVREYHNQKKCKKTTKLLPGSIKIQYEKETRKLLSWRFSGNWIFRPFKSLLVQTQPLKLIPKFRILMFHRFNHFIIVAYEYTHIMNIKPMFSCL